MNTKMTKRGWIIAGTIVALGFAVLTYAGVNGKLPQPQEAANKSDKANPFRGKVGAVDANANTLTVDGKLIYASANTKITKGDKAIKLADIQTGDEVSGTSHQTSDGKTEADTVVVSAKETGKESSSLSQRS